MGNNTLIKPFYNIYKLTAQISIFYFKNLEITISPKNLLILSKTPQIVFFLNLSGQTN